MSKRHYLFFTREQLPQPEAHLVQISQCANAAANLGYSTVLAYPKYGTGIRQIFGTLFPKFKALSKSELRDFYSIDSPNLSLAELPILWPQEKSKHRLTSPSTITCKYYWPLHLQSKTRLAHTRDWNFAKAAIKSGTPVIFESHHHRRTPFEAEFSQSPLLQVAVTVIESVKSSMIDNGIPEEKIKVFPNGYNSYFMLRHDCEAKNWRKKLLGEKYERLIMYAGALYDFKGIDIMLDVAQKYPNFKFAFAGGPQEQIQLYKNQASQRNIQNVEFLGFLEQRTLAHVLQAADVLAHPHRSGAASTFTSPLKLFDYMASGTPIIATQIQSLKHLESSKAIAAWCAPDDSQAFSDCLSQTINGLSKQQVIRPEQIGFVKQFSWESRLENILRYVDASFLPHNIEEAEKWSQ